MERKEAMKEKKKEKMELAQKNPETANPFGDDASLHEGHGTVV
jgi:hypothetical protein